MAVPLGVEVYVCKVAGDFLFVWQLLFGNCRKRATFLLSWWARGGGNALRIAAQPWCVLRWVWWGVDHRLGAYGSPRTTKACGNATPAAPAAHLAARDSGSHQGTCQIVPFVTVLLNGE